MPIYLATVIAMVAFAANSILCRLALAEELIDPGSFTVLRVVSGFVTLAVIHFIVTTPIWRTRFSSRTMPPLQSLVPRTKRAFISTIWGGLSLFIYAISFSFAYVELAAGTGALLLFGAVQLTMIGFHIWQGNTLNRYETQGLVISILGFILLMLPAASAPDLCSSLLMIAAGVSWAVLTLLGKRDNGDSPRIGMTRNFLSAMILSLFLSPWLVSFKDISQLGVVWALLSGAFASGVGYVIWYFALTQLTVLKASVAQLSVPIIALLVGLLLLSEPISLIVVITSLMILGGIALIFFAKNKTN